MGKVISQLHSQFLDNELGFLCQVRISYTGRTVGKVTGQDIYKFSQDMVLELEPVGFLIGVVLLCKLVESSFF